ncbi:spermidine/putrescine ABC transporter substrate-binding protein [soil metagenome]
MSKRYYSGGQRGAPARRISRREMLRRLGMGAGGLSLTAVLAACGIEGQSQDAESDENTGFTTNESTGTLNFANWPLYIDRAKGENPTLNDFTEATDIEVNYDEVIQDNASFFGTIREPLANGDPIDYDLIVVTDWLIDKMARLGYLEELDQGRLANFEANAGGIYKDPSYDPGNRFSIPWQSGITGIAYNRALTGRDLTSMSDLFDTEFAGKIGMFKEMRDTMNLMLLLNGIEPQDAMIDDVEDVQQQLLKQVDDGIVRQYYGNEYADALARKDIIASIAWSGDVIQLTLDDPDLRFVVPDEGGILWVDNMAIPQNAANPIDAHEFMNYVYQPEVAAQIVGWVNYICPVPAAKEILASTKGYESVADSPLVFPTPDMEAKLHNYKLLSEEEEQEWNDLFQQVVQG